MRSATYSVPPGAEHGRNIHRIACRGRMDYPYGDRVAPAVPTLIAAARDSTMKPTRREFLKTIAASAAVLAFKRPLSAHVSGVESKPFEFLVVGDSLIWGQGLDEEHKFYSLTAEWLKHQAFGAQRTVNLKVKAHSGATIRLDPAEAEKFRRAGRDDKHPFTGELNVGFPSMFRQVEAAAAEYRAAGADSGADLVMLTAGITDITVERVLDPFGDNKKLPPLIEEVCFGRVADLLDHIHLHNPRALIAVVGYFPILSPRSSSSKVFNGWLESLNVPSFLKPLLNNPVTRKLVFSMIRRKCIQRSRIWYDGSNRNLQRAVDRLNTKVGHTAAVFIRSPLTEEHSAEAPGTLLFRMRGDGRVVDDRYDQRRADCRSLLPRIKRETGISYSVRRCSMAAVGHPDHQGSRLYADAITSALAPLITKSGRGAPNGAIQPGS